MSRKKSPPVTCDAGLLSRVPKHPICPLPHLRCRSILREPVPIVICTPCEMMPPLISRRLCVEIGDRRYSYSSSIGDTGVNDVHRSACRHPWMQTLLRKHADIAVTTCRVLVKANVNTQLPVVC